MKTTLTDYQRDELLLRLDERVNIIRENQEELKSIMKSDMGFTRCQLHAQSVNDIKGSLKWIRRTVWGAIIVVLVKAGFDNFN